MPRTARDPVWRSSLVVLLRRYPAYGLGLAAGSATLAFAALSGPTIVDAAEIALLRQQADAVPQAAPASDQPVVRAAVFDPRTPRIERRIGAAMSDLDGGGDPVKVRRPILYQDSTLQGRPQAVDLSTGEQASAVIFAATGAVESLVAADGSSPGRPGVWIPDQLAEQLELQPGDTFGVRVAFFGLGGDADPEPSPVTVAGIYRTDPTTGAPQDPTGLWKTLADDLPPWPSFVPRTTPQVPLLVADETTYRSVESAVAERSLVTWDVVPSADPARILDLQTLLESLQVVADDAANPLTPLGRVLVEPAPTDLELLTGFPPMVDAAIDGKRAMIEGVSAVRVVGIGLSWLVVALAAGALLLRRAGERQVLLESGRSVSGLSALMLVECLIPATIGLVAGTLAVAPYSEVLIGPDGFGVRRGDIALVILVVVGTVVVASALDAVRRERATLGLGRGTQIRVPWRTVLVTGSVVVGVAVALGDSGRFNALTATFPLLAIAAVAVLVTSLGTRALQHATARRLPERLVPRLAVAGLARDPTSAVGLLTTMIAFGTVACGVLFSVSATAAADDKVGAEVGARSTVKLHSSRELARLPDVAARSTAVWRLRTGVDDISLVMLVVDPSTFARAALWSSRYADGQSLDDVLASLRPRDDDVVPILVAGNVDVVPASGTLAGGEDWEAPYRVAQRVRAFPGQGGHDPMIVVSSDALFPLLGRAHDPTVLPASQVDPDRTFTTELWSDLPTDELIAAAADHGVALTPIASVAQASTDPLLVARSWSTAYLNAFTAIAFLLGLLILAGLHLRGTDHRRLIDLTLADLGHPKGSGSRAVGVELTTVTIIGAMVGGLTSYAVTWALRARLDPLPDRVPALVVTGAPQVLLAAAAFCVVAVALAVGAGRARRPRPVNELLRDE